MSTDEDRYRAVQAKDARFDGCFITAVLSTGIYCRPSCPAIVPRRANVRFYPSSAAAQAAGFRACKRCRPDAAPGSPDWDRRGDLVGRALRLIADGAIERIGVPGLAREVAVSERHLHRVLVAEVGAGPLALARAQRATTARVLVETTDLPFTHVAFASGFASVRQFNDTIREVFASSPTDLRARAARRREAHTPEPGTITVRLPYRPPCDVEGVLGFLAVRAVPGVEERSEDGSYRRTLRLPSGTGTVTLRPEPGSPAVRCTLRLDDLGDLPVAVRRCRRLLDLDADPHAIVDVLGEDPLLGPVARSAPGVRVPGSVDGAELAVRAVLGQQVSVAGARTLAGRLVAALGTPLDRADGGLTHRFPDAAAIAAAPDDVLAAALPGPASRRQTLRRVCEAIADGSVRLDAGADRAETVARLRAVPGIGPWTASYVAMRALGDPDAFVEGDLVVRRAVGRLLGPPAIPSVTPPAIPLRTPPAIPLRTPPAIPSVTAAAAAAIAEAWRPWRSYAVLHLWRSS